MSNALTQEIINELHPSLAAYITADSCPNPLPGDAESILRCFIKRYAPGVESIVRANSNYAGNNTTGFINTVLTKMTDLTPVISMNNPATEMFTDLELHNSEIITVINAIDDTITFRDNSMEQHTLTIPQLIKFFLTNKRRVSFVTRKTTTSAGNPITNEVDIGSLCKELYRMVVFMLVELKHLINVNSRPMGNYDVLASHQGMRGLPKSITCEQLITSVLARNMYEAVTVGYNGANGSVLDCFIYDERHTTQKEIDQWRHPDHSFFRQSLLAMHHDLVLFAGFMLEILISCFMHQGMCFDKKKERTKLSKKDFHTEFIRSSCAVSSGRAAHVYNYLDTIVSFLVSVPIFNKNAQMSFKNLKRNFSIVSTSFKDAAYARRLRNLNQFATDDTKFKTYEEIFNNYADHYLKFAEIMQSASDYLYKTLFEGTTLANFVTANTNNIHTIREGLQVLLCSLIGVEQCKKDPKIIGKIINFINRSIIATSQTPSGIKAEYAILAAPGEFNSRYVDKALLDFLTTLSENGSVEKFKKASNTAADNTSKDSFTGKMNEASLLSFEYISSTLFCGEFISPRNLYEEIELSPTPRTKVVCLLYMYLRHILYSFTNTHTPYYESGSRTSPEPGIKVSDMAA